MNHSPPYAFLRFALPKIEFAPQLSEVGVRRRWLFRSLVFGRGVRPSRDHRRDLADRFLPPTLWDTKSEAMTAMGRVGKPQRRL